MSLHGFALNRPLMQPPTAYCRASFQAYKSGLLVFEAADNGKRPTDRSDQQGAVCECGGLDQRPVLETTLLDAVGVEEVVDLLLTPAHSEFLLDQRVDRPAS